ncbi:MAG: Clp protease ClpP [Smithella sp.]
MPNVGRKAPKGKEHRQSIRFKKENGWTESNSKDWVKEHDGFTDGMEETDNEFRFRQYDPDYSEFHYRTYDKELPAGIYFVIGYPGEEKGEDKMKQGVFLRAMASDATEAIIDIIGVIGWQVAYAGVRDMLRSIPDNIKRVVFDIYSPGGDVWEGNGIVQEIGELGKRAETIARIQVAASMATLIAVACQKRVMAANGRWLIHNAWTQTMGDAAEHEKAAKTLRDAENEAAKFYAERTNGTPEAMLALMSEERWILPEEAKSLGFVQEICDPFKPEDFEAVKQEIVSAGKWPKSLVELPDVTPKTEEDANGSKPDKWAGENASTKSAGAVPADDQTEHKEYLRGLADGIAQGQASAVSEFGTQVSALKVELELAQTESRKHQSEKDKLTAALKTTQAMSDERAEVLRKELETATAKLKQFLSGALTFSPAIETWADALAACNGNYEKARSQYAAIFEKYLADERRKGTR